VYEKNNILSIALSYFELTRKWINLIEIDDQDNIQTSFEILIKTIQLVLGFS